MLTGEVGLPVERDNWGLAVAVGVVGVLIIVGALYFSKKQTAMGRDEDQAPAKASPAPAAAGAAPAATKEQPKKKH